MHAEELVVEAETVRRLVAEQLPGLAGLAVAEVVADGTVNTVFRLGDRFAARFPRQPDEVPVVRARLAQEAAAARELLGRTAFATPEPVALGEPGAGYPLPWSVQTWLPGRTAVQDDAGSATGFAHDLARFLSEVRAIDTRGRTYAGDNRGGELRSRDAWMGTCFSRSARLLDVDRLRRLWAELRELPRTAADAMTHGDLMPGNVLVAAGRLVGVLDVGGFGPADPALDLVGAWHLLEDEPRAVLRTDLGCDELEWERGRAWAFEQAMGLVWYYADSAPTLAATGRRTLARLQGDDPG